MINSVRAVGVDSGINIAYNNVHSEKIKFDANPIRNNAFSTPSRFFESDISHPYWSRLALMPKLENTIIVVTRL